MNRETNPDINHCLETIRKRTNETGVDIALRDLLKVSRNLSTAEATSVVEAVIPILQDGVHNGPNGPLTKVKDPKVLANAIQVLSLSAKEAAHMLPKLGMDFFGNIPQSFEARYAGLSLYIEARSSWQNSYEVFLWLQQAGTRTLILESFRSFADGSQTGDSDKLKNCALALDMMGADLSETTAPKDLSGLDLYRLGARFLQLPSESAASARDLRRTMCNALTNVIVVWRKKRSLTSEGKEGPKGENELATLMMDYITEASATPNHSTRVEISMCALRVLSNMCYNSRRAARALVELQVHKEAIKAIQQVKLRDHTRAAATLLANLARKQVRLHQSLVEKGIGTALKAVLETSLNDPGAVTAILCCALNLVSSHVGRISLYPLEPLVLGQVLSLYSSKPDIVELSLGVLWGVCTKENIKTDEKYVEWFTVVFQVMQQNTQHLGCVLRGLGAVFLMVSTHPQSKRVLESHRDRSKLTAIIEKHKDNPVVSPFGTILQQ